MIIQAIAIIFIIVMTGYALYLVMNGSEAKQDKWF